MDKAGEFRFGVNMVAPGARADWVAKCRRAEAAGYEVIGVADHLGMPPPFPALVLAAEAGSATNLTAEQLDELPTLLVGTHRQIADQLVANRERFGFSYVTVLEENLERFAPVIELLR
jgi:alkanesulfonate monooxygenase SsuD/methylene tetrahydromethanopterin reductase-like flavin-dependent oxidoreductase (luciferase family)